MSFTQRIENILHITNEEDVVKRLISDVAVSVVNYDDCVMCNADAIKTLRFIGDDSEKFKEAVTRLDRLQHFAHERVIDSIKIANRYLFKKYGANIPAGGVYTDDPFHLSVGNRDAIAGWALAEAGTLRRRGCLGKILTKGAAKINEQCDRM